MLLIEDEEEISGNSLPSNCSQTVPNCSQQFSEEFKAAFRRVAQHYQCTAEEVKLMKLCARDNPDDAIACFMGLEQEIKSSMPYQEEGIAISAADMVIEPKRETKGGRDERSYD